MEVLSKVLGSEFEWPLKQALQNNSSPLIPSSPRAICHPASARLTCD